MQKSEIVCYAELTPQCDDLSILLTEPLAMHNVYEFTNLHQAFVLCPNLFFVLSSLLCLTRPSVPFGRLVLWGDEHLHKHRYEGTKSLDLFK